MYHESADSRGGDRDRVVSAQSITKWHMCSTNTMKIVIQVLFRGIYTRPVVHAVDATNTVDLISSRTKPFYALSFLCGNHDNTSVSRRKRREAASCESAQPDVRYKVSAKTVEERNIYVFIVTADWVGVRPPSSYEPHFDKPCTQDTVLFDTGHRSTVPKLSLEQPEDREGGRGKVAGCPSARNHDSVAIRSTFAETVQLGKWT